MRLSAASLATKEDSNADREISPKVANTSKKRKNYVTDAVVSSNGQRPGSSTPKRKRAAHTVPPITPTPSAIGLMTAPVATGTMAPPPVNLLAVPNGTNVKLVTPETHRVMTNHPMDQAAPSGAANIKNTNGHMLDEAVAHLIKIEPKLKPVIEKHHCHMFSPEGLAEEIDPFVSLTSGIISQQVRRNNS